MFSRIPFHRVNWLTSSFLIGTFVLSITTVPVYLWYFGIDWFQIILFFVLLSATGFSITLGYHRLFSHLAFRARLPVKLFVLIFGPAAFENSVLMWASEHRRHHKHVDHEEDPYDITKGFFHARSEEHTSELQSLAYLVCRLLLEKKKTNVDFYSDIIYNHIDI